MDNLLIQLCSEVTPYWYQFGTIVGIDKDTLKKYLTFPPDECIIEVLDYWLRNHHDGKPDVAVVLKEMKLDKLAENIL